MDRSSTLFSRTQCSTYSLTPTTLQSTKLTFSTLSQIKSAVHTRKYASKPGVTKSYFFSLDFQWWEQVCADRWEKWGGLGAMHPPCGRRRTVLESGIRRTWNQQWWSSGLEGLAQEKTDGVTAQYFTWCRCSWGVLCFFLCKVDVNSGADKKKDLRNYLYLG